MDPNSHKRLADNAFIKAKEIFNKEIKTEYKNMLHFAHVARLHYQYASLDPNNEEMNRLIKKTDQFLIEVYKKLELFDTVKFLEKN
ncbi:hypothetical protein ACAG96_00135 [Candidatus Izemoplasma sp. B36]|uniref:hypothetical protein n=1 Tax=Candidatus Izemoplasma sp. B36 TaxID=3242468 RepID=UPI0035578389